MFFINVVELTPLSDTLSSSILHLKQNRFSEIGAIFFSHRNILQNVCKYSFEDILLSGKDYWDCTLQWLEYHLLCGQIKLQNHHHQICTICNNKLNNCTNIICKIFAIFLQFIASEWTATKITWSIRKFSLMHFCQPMLLHLNCQIGNPSRLLGNSLPKQG